jgi:signal transduction histidine kinase
MERFGRGDRAARAQETGPAELRDMSFRFNQMAASLMAERDAQLAFLGGVAHDLRNPLSALQITLSPIRPGKPLPPEPRIRLTFERITRQITRIDRMIGDLLDTAAIQSGKLELKLERRDARELVGEVVELFEGASREHAIELVLPEQAVEITCDPSRIVQVVTNLVSNAIKYSPGTPKIDVVVSHVDGDAVISVRDYGVGIGNPDRERLFEPYARGGLSKEAIPGVGLGLFVVRRIVEAHGGSVEVESVLGEGSTFVVRIPLARPVESSREMRPHDHAYN